MFERNLEDLIRGLRANKKTESIFIGQVLGEIREELKSNDFAKKTLAISKLTYLQMVGVDIGWASFNVIEVMTQQRFSAKRIGYLAACQSFHEGTEVITLATNLIRKDMTSSDIYSSGIAINCLANICTPDLARDLAADVVALLSSSRPYIRKKACLVLYKIFLKFPDALRPSFPRLKEKLEDPEPAVIDAAVNVICELARKNPKNYISLAPLLFKIMTATDRPSNNWVLIKIVKLFAALLPIEERLAKKLVQPLTNIMNTTTAMSLQYECIQTCTIGLSDHLPTIKLCISKLRNFVEDPDQNLKYLGLLALNNIMKIHPKAVAEHRDLVLNCLEDQDTSIRLRALDLLEGMVSKRNIVDIVKKLLDNIEKAEPGQYKEALVEKVVSVCSKNSYQSVTDFEWYISVLMELAHISGTSHGNLISAQFMDVIIRVNVVRDFGVKNMLSLLRDSQLLSDNLREGGNCEVLYAAAWVIGEFSSSVDDKLGAIEALLQPRVVHLPAHIQIIYMQSALKIFGSAASSGSSKSSSNLLDPEDKPTPRPTYSKLNEIIKIMQARLPLFTQSQFLEVQERACFDLEVLKLYTELQSAGTEIGSELASLFDEPLNPVAPKAQKKVPIPEGLDLDKWINDEPEEFAAEEDNADAWDFEAGKSSDKEVVRDKSFDFIGSGIDSTSEDDRYMSGKSSKGHAKKSSPVAKTGPYYLSGSTKKKDMEDEIPSVRLSAGELGVQEQTINYKDRLKSAKPSKSSRSKSKQAAAQILKDEDLEGDEPELEDKAVEDEESALNKIDLSKPLSSDERLPVGTHRISKLPEKPKEEKKSRRGRDESRSSRSGKHRSSKDKEKEKESSSKKSSSSSAKTDSKLIDFDPLPTPSSPSPAAYTAVMSPVVEEKKHRSSRSERSSKDDRKKRDSKDKDDRKSSSSSRRSKDSKEKEKSSSSRSSKSETTATAPTPTRGPAKFKPLCQDENLSVIYELKVSPKDGKKIMVAFAFKNLSQNEVSEVEFQVPPTMNLKVSGDASTKSPATLQPGETANLNVIFDCQSFQQLQRVPGSISYQAGDHTGKKDFNIIIPSSASILPIKLEKEQFVSTLRESTFNLSSTEVRLEDEFPNFIVSLAMLLHVELIFQETGVSLYGKSVQGHQVAVYAKPKDENIVSVQLKCTDDALGKSLINEVSNFFPRP